MLLFFLNQGQHLSMCSYCYVPWLSIQFFISSNPSDNCKFFSLSLETLLPESSVLLLPFGLLVSILATQLHSCCSGASLCQYPGNSLHLLPVWVSCFLKSLSSSFLVYTLFGQYILQQFPGKLGWVVIWNPGGGGCPEKEAKWLVVPVS